MKPRILEPGEIVQLAPTSRDGFDHFGGCLMVVTEAKSFGAVGYVKNAGHAIEMPFRAPFEDMEPTGGRVIWATSAVVPVRGEAAAEQAARGEAVAPRG